VVLPAYAAAPCNEDETDNWNPEDWGRGWALCSRAICVHLEHVVYGNGFINLCAPRRFTLRAFPALRQLKFRDDAYEHEINSFISLKSDPADLAHAGLEELDLVCIYAQPFQWDRSRLPSLRCLRLRADRDMHESVLPLLDSVTLSFAWNNKYRQALAQLRAAPRWPRLMLIRTNSETGFEALCESSEWARVECLIVEGDCWQLRSDHLTGLAGVRKLVLAAPSRHVVAALPGSLRQLSLLRSTMDEAACDRVLALRDAGCVVHLIRCSVLGLDEARFRERVCRCHPRSADWLLGRVQFVKRFALSPAATEPTGS
jgi:hypothetical protein